MTSFFPVIPLYQHSILFPLYLSHCDKPCAYSICGLKEVLRKYSFLPLKPPYMFSKGNISLFLSYCECGLVLVCLCFVCLFFLFVVVYFWFGWVGFVLFCFKPTNQKIATSKLWVYYLPRNHVLCALNPGCLHHATAHTA